jgi:hypothetical protein
VKNHPSTRIHFHDCYRRNFVVAEASRINYAAAGQQPCDAKPGGQIEGMKLKVVQASTDCVSSLCDFQRIMSQYVAAETCVLALLFCEAELECAHATN